MNATVPIKLSFVIDPLTKLGNIVAFSGNKQINSTPEKTIVRVIDRNDVLFTLFRNKGAFSVIGIKHKKSCFKLAQLNLDGKIYEFSWK